MSLLRSAMKAGIAVKALDIVKRELSKPENQRKLKSMAGKAQAEFRKPENQQKAKDVLGKVTRRSKGAPATSRPVVVVPPADRMDER